MIEQCRYDEIDWPAGGHQLCRRAGGIRFNSTVARTAGMMATGQLGESGDVLIQGFHMAILACVVASVGTSASAFLLISPKQKAKA